MDVSPFPDTFWCKYPSLDTVWCNTDMINAEFVYHTDSAFIMFMGLKTRFSCNFNEKLLPHDQKDRAGALFLPK